MQLLCIVFRCSCSPSPLFCPHRDVFFQLGLVLRTMGYNPSEKQVSTQRTSTDLHHPTSLLLTLSLSALRSLHSSSGRQLAELASSCPNPDHITSADLTRLTLSAPKPASSNEKDLLEAFRVFDRDENGLITLNEIRVIFTTLGETIGVDEVNSVLEQVTVDDNGKVKYADFVKLILKP